jgi:hypothetical protein
MRGLDPKPDTRIFDFAANADLVLLLQLYLIDPGCAQGNIVAKDGDFPLALSV